VNRPSKPRRAPWFAYMWPGLPHLWVNGSWAGLVLAIGFAVLLNLAIVGTFVWPELLPARARWIGGGLLAVLWLAALWETRGELRRQAARRDGESPLPQDVADAERQAEVDRLFIAAQASYLASDWAEAEKILLDALRLERDDIECQLLLATMWRHSGRKNEAIRRLRRLSRLDAATGWQFEIQRELAFANPEIPGSDDAASRADDSTWAPSDAA
jgi:tetratricopeptide (TPR) repeat protein